MSEYTDASKLLLSFIKERQFLFRKEMKDFSITDYLRWFEKKTDTDFFAFPAMMSYEAKIIDLYSKKVVNSMFVPLSGGMLALHTIVQLSPTCHLIFVYTSSQDRRKMVAYCTVYSNHADDFFEFTDKCSTYALDDERHMGFSGIPTEKNEEEN